MITYFTAATWALPAAPNTIKGKINNKFSSIAIQLVKNDCALHPQILLITIKPTSDSLSLADISSLVYG